MELLTAVEQAILGRQLPRVDCARVRLHRGRSLRPLRRLVLWASRGRAVALGNHVFLPDHCRGDLAVLAHELTHCGQYQRWGSWRYFSRGAAAQLHELLHRKLGIGTSPYEYRLEPGKPLEAYGMEQQAQIVEDHFRALAGAREAGYRPPSG